MDDTLLTAHDREQIAIAARVGRDLTAPVSVTYFFYAPGREPTAAAQALHQMGITDTIPDEEITGDGYWHIAAFTSLPLTGSAIADMNEVMRHLAARTGVTCDGWRVTTTAGEDWTLAH